MLLPSLLITITDRRELTGEILESNKLHVIVLIQEYLKLCDANSQISLVEFVRIVPAHGTVLAPLLYNCVKEAQRKDQGLESFRLFGAFEKVGFAYWVLKKR